MKMLIVRMGNPERYSQRELANADLVLAWAGPGNPDSYWCVKAKRGKSHQSVSNGQLIRRIRTFLEQSAP